MSETSERETIRAEVSTTERKPGMKIYAVVGKVVIAAVAVYLSLLALELDLGVRELLGMAGMWPSW